MHIVLIYIFFAHFDESWVLCSISLTLLLIVHFLFQFPLCDFSKQIVDWQFSFSCFSFKCSE